MEQKHTHLHTWSLWSVFHDRSWKTVVLSWFASSSALTLSLCVCVLSLEFLLLHQRELWSNLLCDLPSTHLHTHKRQKNRTRGNKKANQHQFICIECRLLFFVFDPSPRGWSVGRPNGVFHDFLFKASLVSRFWITYFQITVSTSHRK